MVVKNYKTITIAEEFYKTNKISTPIFLQFIPSHFIIRSASFSLVLDDADLNTDVVLLLKTSLNNNDTIVHFAVNNIPNYETAAIIQTMWSGNLDLKYKINPTTINGNYDFIFTDIAGDVPLNMDHITIDFALTIEFVEEI